jgi:hypothetical protein
MFDRNIVARNEPGRRVEVGDGPLLYGSSQQNGTPLAEDDYFSRLVKYVPIEMIGMYIVISGAFDAGLGRNERAYRISLIVLVLLGCVTTWFFGWRALNIRRKSQLTMSVVAFLIWTSTGGTWQGMIPSWRPWMATIGVAGFGVLVKIIRVDPLPNEEDPPKPPAAERVCTR